MWTGVRVRARARVCVCVCVYVCVCVRAGGGSMILGPLVDCLGARSPPTILHANQKNSLGWHVCRTKLPPKNF